MVSSQCTQRQYLKLKAKITIKWYRQRKEKYLPVSELCLALPLLISTPFAMIIDYIKLSHNNPL
jgi:hypothetical protein